MWKQMKRKLISHSLSYKLAYLATLHVAFSSIKIDLFISEVILPTSV